MYGRVWVVGLVASGCTMAADVTFNKDVLPILQKHCQECHRPGNVAPMSFLNYEGTRPWAKAMKSAVASRKMPPWFADPKYGHFANDRSLTQAEIDTISKWADGGAAKGADKDAPPPRAFPENGWTAKPDVIAKGIPYRVPAATPRDVIEWIDVITPGVFREDTWVTSLEIKPSELGVTHHICTSFIPHREGVQYNVPMWVDKKRDERGIEVAPSERKVLVSTPDGKGKLVDRNAPEAQLRNGSLGFVCYVPGRALHDFRPFQAAMRIPKGWDILWQLHYTPNGKEAIDTPELGMTVTRQAPQRTMIESFTGTGGPGFAIPPKEANYAAPPQQVTFLADAELVWMSPHMHLRGKDMTYKLVYPTGESNIVLNVPKYDFNWQIGYEVAKPIKVPKGSKLVVEAHYDNSPNNKFNPNPDQTVYEGNMTWEEMFAPFFAITVDKSVDPQKAVTAPQGARGGA